MSKTTHSISGTPWYLQLLFVGAALLLMGVATSAWGSQDFFVAAAAFALMLFMLWNAWKMMRPSIRTTDVGLCLYTARKPELFRWDHIDSMSVHQHPTHPEFLVISVNAAERVGTFQINPQRPGERRLCRIIAQQATQYPFQLQIHGDGWLWLDSLMLSRSFTYTTQASVLLFVLVLIPLCGIITIWLVKP